MKIQKIRDVKTPQRGTPESAGLDFFVPNDFEEVIITPGRDINIPSGIKANIPAGFALIAFNKSGVSLKKGLQVGASVVDSDYTGEIHLHVINTGKNLAIISPGEKLVQFILIPVLLEDVEIVGSIEKETERGEGCFGSTGTE